MKLTIKNHDKCIGWAFEGPDNNLVWKIRSVNEKDYRYEFALTLFDKLNNAVCGRWIYLSRNPEKDSDGDYSFRFLPHKNHMVTAKWFSKTGNAYEAFENEIETLNENY